MDYLSDKEGQTDLTSAIDKVDVKELIVFNDDYNTFEHVTDTLIRACKHDSDQAEQCTWLIHYKGKCTVKTGEYSDLKPMCKKITDAGIDAKIL